MFVHLDSEFMVSFSSVFNILTKKVRFFGCSVFCFVLFWFFFFEDVEDSSCNSYAIRKYKFFMIFLITTLDIQAYKLILDKWNQQIQ